MDLSQANRMAEMALDMTEQPDLKNTVGRILANAQRSISCDGISLCLVRDGAWEQTKATSEVVRQAQAFQIEIREGPSWSPHVCQDWSLIADTAGDSRWNVWCSYVAQLGLRSVLSVRLFTPARTVGALTVYGRSPEAFTAEDADLARVFGRHASIALMGAQHGDSLHAAIASRHLIGQAQGILMERYRVDSDRAFTVLRRYSQDRNIKLRAIAEQVIASHRLPE